jgi:NAD(P)-dependent dehydrogenase (short-subunit alcohol dehydrogenase family)
VVTTALVRALRPPRLRSLDGARVVITGGGSGIGAAIAELAAQQGAVVHLADLRLDRAEALRDRLGPAHHAHQLDVSDAEAVAELAARIEAEGPVDVLVNNAGIALAGATLDTPRQSWERVLDVNLRGVLYGALAFGPAMRARQRGHIVNIASAAGLTGLPMLAAYSVAKCGVVALSESLVHELRPHGVGVSVVCPGFVRTRLMEEAPVPLARADVNLDTANSLSDLPWRDPEDVAEAVLRAVRRGRFFVPVFAEGRLLSLARRLSPAGVGLVKDLLVQRRV